MSIKKLREVYHQKICNEIVFLNSPGKKYGSYYNFADGDSRSSVMGAHGIIERLGYTLSAKKVTAQTAGTLFENFTSEYLQSSLHELAHLRPGRWVYQTSSKITQFEQYAHLEYLIDAVKEDKNLEAALGSDYLVKPDIVISKKPLTDEEINRKDEIVSSVGSLAKYTPVRAVNQLTARSILHSSISCKWSIRSDRAQNTRTEALNLIRNRKGHVPHIVVVTAEPLPTRLAAIALGTGDLDCVYHFALEELRSTFEAYDSGDQLDMLNILIEGNRLRDISDLPFDLLM